MMPKQFSSPMPDVLFVIDNDYEQRYYRSPETAAKGLNGWLSRDHGQLVAYRRIDEGAPSLAAIVKIIDDAHAEFAKLYPRGYQHGTTSMAQWNKDQAAMNKKVHAEITKLLGRVR